MLVLVIVAHFYLISSGILQALSKLFLRMMVNEYEFCKVYIYGNIRKYMRNNHPHLYSFMIFSLNLKKILKKAPFLDFSNVVTPSIVNFLSVQGTLLFFFFNKSGMINRQILNADIVLHKT